MTHKPSGLPRWVRHMTRFALYLVLDAGAITLAYWLAYKVRFESAWWTSHFLIEGIDPGWAHHSDVMYVIVPLWLFLFFYTSQLYTKPWSNPFDHFLRIIKTAVFCTVATMAATFIYGRLEYSRLMLLLASPIAVVTVSISHALVGWLDKFMASLEAASPLLLIGSGKVADLVRSNILDRHPNAPIRVIEGLPSIDEIQRLAREEGFKEVVLTRGGVDHDKLLEIAEFCETNKINFRMIPDLLSIRLGEIQMDESLGLPAYRLQHTQLTTSHYIAKRTFDIVFSLSVLFLLGLPFLIIAILIRLDSKGPALYRQDRLGFRGETFEAFKFRTMVLNAESDLNSVKKINDQKGGFFKAKKDPRITAVGRWLRRYSVDEFPQFINVLVGEMSVVGPRPLACKTAEMEDLIKEFGPTAKKRMNTLPGITGLWQVSGRSDISSEQRFALDMFYIERWSLGLDLEIILRTIPAMISGRGAY